MSDIERWTDEDAPDEIHELFRAARRESPRAKSLEKALVAVGAVTAAGTVAGGASAAVPASQLAIILKWGLGGVLSGLMVAGGASIALDQAKPHARVAPVVASADVPRPSTIEAPPKLAATNIEAPPPQPSARPTLAPRPSASFAASPEADARMAAELAVLDSARRAVDAKDGTRALAELARHQREFGANGRFLPEARYLKLEALMLGKDRDQARAAAKQILSEDPSSPHAPRAKSVLEQNP